MTGAPTRSASASASVHPALGAGEFGSRGRSSRATSAATASTTTAMARSTRATCGDVACTTDQPGVCSAGLTLCEEGGIACVPRFEAGEEVCDGLDNDCDGAVDESDTARARSRATATAARTARWGSGSARAACSAAPTATGSASGEVRPRQRSRDGLDNDCDGLIDEGNPEGGFACSTGLPGVCGNGVTLCHDGELICDGASEPGGGRGVRWLRQRLRRADR